MSEYDDSEDHHGYSTDKEEASALAMIIGFHGRKRHERTGASIEHDSMCDSDCGDIKKYFRNSLRIVIVEQSISSASLSVRDFKERLKQFMEIEFTGPRIIVYIGQGCEEDSAAICLKDGDIDASDILEAWQ